MRYLIFLLSTAAAAQTLSVTILDYADVPPNTIDGAGAVFSTIYQKAGGRVEWRVEKRVWLPEQSTRFADVPGDVVLRICNKEMARLLVRKGSVLGYAQPTGEGEVRRVATVFYSHVEDVAVATSSSVAGVLGTALAHELGHLLLGRGAHSRGGIMRCPWDTEELRAMHRGQLVFDAAQALSIAKSIAARSPGLRAAAR